MKKIFIILGLFIFSVITRNLDAEEKIDRREQNVLVSSEQISYSVIDEKIIDVPRKTAVSMAILVSGKITEKNLNDLLNKLYASTLARREFKFHSAPTNIYIYAFISKEHYDSGLGQWIAMLMKSYDDQKPSIKINQSQIRQVVAKPEEKFGLSEEQRKMIFKELVVYEEKSWKKAEETYTLPESLNYSKEFGMNQVLKRGIFQEILNKKYSEKVAKKYSLTIEQLKEISSEGITKDWPVNINENILMASYELTEKQIKELISETELEMIKKEGKEKIRQNRPLPQIETKEDLALDLNKGMLGQLKVGDVYENNDSLFKILGGPPDNIYFSYKNYYYKRGIVIDVGKQKTTGKNSIFDITIFRIPMNFFDDWMVRFRGQIIPSLEDKENKATLIRKFGIPDEESGYTTALLQKLLIFVNTRSLRKCLLCTVQDLTKNSQWFDRLTIL